MHVPSDYVARGPHDIVGVNHKGLAGHAEIGKVKGMRKRTTIVDGHGGFINSAAAEQHSLLHLLFILS